jgi:hypothetical protein
MTTKRDIGSYAYSDCHGYIGSDFPFRGDFPQIVPKPDHDVLVIGTFRLYCEVNGHIIVTHRSERIVWAKKTQWAKDCELYRNCCPMDEP